MYNRSKLLFLVLGIGIGITIANTIHTFYPAIEYIEYSDEEITSRAKDLGMVFVKESIDVDSTKEKPNKELDKDSEKGIEVTVQAGDTLMVIAQRLYELELIDNAKSFSQYAKAKNVDKHLRAGNHMIPYNLDYEAIITILMRKQ
ncbi:MAG: endolytic transglycosylase MltG [Tissierellia bacterium]|nr:endolytic transglycosylase MltG [Tissierellia bacterium]